MTNVTIGPHNEKDKDRVFGWARTVDGDGVDALGEEVLVHHVHVARALCKHQHGRRRLLQALAHARQLVLRFDVLHFLHTHAHALDDTRCSRARLLAVRRIATAAEICARGTPQRGGRQGGDGCAPASRRGWRRRRARR